MIYKKQPCKHTTPAGLIMIILEKCQKVKSFCKKSKFTKDNICIAAATLHRLFRKTNLNYINAARRYFGAEARIFDADLIAEILEL